MIEESQYRLPKEQPKHEPTDEERRLLPQGCGAGPFQGQSLGEAGNYLRQRAKDMGITIIEDIQYMEDAELEGIIKNLACN